jgi:flagellar hook-associated protein 1 FlgK
MDATMQVAGMQTSAMSTWTGLNEARAQQAEDAQIALSSATGVNIDDQMQRLLIVQQTYAASAQVVRAASGMMDALMSALR